REDRQAVEAKTARSSHAPLGKKRPEGISPSDLVAEANPASGLTDVDFPRFQGFGLRQRNPKDAVLQFRMNFVPFDPILMLENEFVRCACRLAMEKAPAIRVFP